jgi:hypothetical protein
MDVDREPTADEASGIAWWNSLSESMRAYWCELAKSYIAADAWAYFKTTRPEEAAAAAWPKSPPATDD